MNDKQLRSELAAIFRLIRKERPDLARKLRRCLYTLILERLIRNGHLVPVMVPTEPAPRTVH